MNRNGVTVALAALLIALAGAIPAQGHLVRGTIRESSVAAGVRPLAGATVRLTPGGYTGISDGAGVYVIANVPHGTYQLRVAAPSHLPVSATVQVVSDITLDYTLQFRETVRSTLRGTVTESGSFGRRALAGATIRLSPGNHAASTDASGQFVIGGIPRGAYLVTASASGHRTATQRITLGSDKQISLDLKAIEAIQRVTLSGVIRGTDKDGVVHVLPDATLRLSPGSHRATTGTDGRFSIDGLPAGTYTLNVRADGFRSVTQRIAIDAHRAVDLTLISRATGDDDSDDRDDGKGKKEKKEKKEKKAKKQGHGRGNGKGG